MIKFTVHSPDPTADIAQQQMLLDQMLELVATAKLLRRFCSELRALVDEVPVRQVQQLLERTEAAYAQAVQHLELLQSALIEPEPSSNDAAQELP